jgi:hypothetical protein
MPLSSVKRTTSTGAAAGGFAYAASKKADVSAHIATAAIERRTILLESFMVASTRVC